MGLLVRVPGSLTYSVKIAVPRSWGFWLGSKQHYKSGPELGGCSLIYSLAFNVHDSIIVQMKIYKCAVQPLCTLCTL